MINLNIIGSFLLYLLFNINDFFIFVIGGSIALSLLFLPFVYFNKKLGKSKIAKIYTGFFIVWIISQLLSLISGTLAFNFKIVLKDFITYPIIIFLGSLILEKIDKSVKSKYSMPKPLEIYFPLLITILIGMTIIFIIFNIGRVMT